MMASQPKTQALPLAPPPYHEADAYPRVRTRTRRLQRTCSFPVGVAIAILGAVTWFGFLLQRETSARAVVQEANLPIQLTQFEKSSKQCVALRTFPTRLDPASRKTNPRWNDATGQNEAVVLRNATLFDGEAFVSAPVDIVFEKGIITSVSPTGGNKKTWSATAQEFHLDGQWVTPGLVDMHSHHGVSSWPAAQARDDSNEALTEAGPLTPFVRVLDGMKAYDQGTVMIAAGGVTTSLVIPGSANIMGGEGTVLKNRLKSGRNTEYVVEELLLEHGIPEEKRHRYMKMACGENPKGLYGHTRMGNAWVLRKHLARAKELLDKQDAWCAAAAHVQGHDAATQQRFLERMGGGLPEDLELESTVGMLRGRVAMHNHCYEPEDFETMLRVSKEFGFRVRAFHHAIAAWRVPEMLKEYGQNVTIATFAEFALYKWEAYDASLYAGEVLAEHGVPVAFKSDHVLESTNARYLLSQAAAAHAFHLPADLALQAVTSVPAKAIDLDDRVGYVRPGYDADVVVWDAHPLSIGATPRQVFIDGVATLEPAKVEESMRVSDKQGTSEVRQPAMRFTMEAEAQNNLCAKADKKNQRFIVNGVQRSFLQGLPKSAISTTGTNLTLVISDGQIECLGSAAACEKQITSASQQDALTLNLTNGYLLPGLTAVATTLGLQEISLDPDTSGGVISPLLDPQDDKNIDYAKYGITLDGKSFVRARLGGVTRAVVPPLSLGGLVRGVSTGFFTSGKRNLLNGGLFKDDVAIHVSLGSATQVSPGSNSFAIKELREILELGAASAQDEAKDENLFASVARGLLTLVVHVESETDIQQVILLKQDLVRSKGLSSLNIVIYGGHEASLVANELAAANIPVILTGHRGSISTWETRKSLPGPPLSRSPASVLSEAGVLFALAMAGEPPEGESRIHALALEAAWAAKYAGLGEQDAIALVSRNIETILGLDPSGDVVVWEGNPLEHGGRPVLAFQAVQGDGLELAACLPDEKSE